MKLIPLEDALLTKKSLIWYVLIVFEIESNSQQIRLYSDKLNCRFANKGDDDLRFVMPTEPDVKLKYECKCCTKLIDG